MQDSEMNEALREWMQQRNRIMQNLASVVKLQEYNTKAENFRDIVEVGILIDF